MIVNLRTLQPRNQLRVVFDTNAFRSNTFDLLAAGPMLTLCQQGRVTPIYGHVFLEETLRTYGNDAKRGALVKNWLPFIFASTDRLCNDFSLIWHQEVVEGRGPRAKLYLRRREFNIIKARYSNIPLDGSWRAWHATKDERAAEDKKRAKQRELNKEMRKTVADWKKAVRYHPKRHGKFDLEQYFESEVEHTGRKFIGTVVPSRSSSAVADRWARDKRGYPFFTACIIGMLYMGQYAMTQQNKAIDLNAQADLFLMTHLLHSDILVSNETGFLRDAFNDLWKPWGKMLMTSAEFDALLRKL
jgi:hypothetical protein